MIVRAHLYRRREEEARATERTNQRKSAMDVSRKVVTSRVIAIRRKLLRLSLGDRLKGRCIPRSPDEPLRIADLAKCALRASDGACRLDALLARVLRGIVTGDGNVC